MTNTIYAINADGQEYYTTVRAERVAESIKRLQQQGWLQVRVVE